MLHRTSDDQPSFHTHLVVQFPGHLQVRISQLATCEKSAKQETEQTQPTHGYFPPQDMPDSNSAAGLSPLKNLKVSTTWIPFSVLTGSDNPSIVRLPFQEQWPIGHSGMTSHVQQSKFPLLQQILEYLGIQTQKEKQLDHT